MSGAEVKEVNGAEEEEVNGAEVEDGHLFSRLLLG